MRALQTLAVAAAGLLVGLAVACGAESSTPTPTSVVTVPTATPLPSTSGGGAPTGSWRTDRNVGVTVGAVAHDASLTLQSGESASLQQLADGRPLLLYFFETW